MHQITRSLKSLKAELPRKYAQWRIGALTEEAISYNTTDRVLLTFDDYGDDATIQQLLGILRREHIKAVFFLQGDWAKAHPEQVEAIRKAGHWIGNHSFSHPHLNQLSDDAVRQELTRGLQTRLMRPPYGAYDARVRKIAHDLGFKIGYWTVDSWDWKGISAQQILDIVLPRMHPGACVLLHLNAPHTLEALPEMIAGIRAQGLTFCTDGTEIDES